jgi:hypothetical protein
MLLSWFLFAIRRCGSREKKNATTAPVTRRGMAPIADPRALPITSRRKSTFIFGEVLSTCQVTVEEMTHT